MEPLLKAVVGIVFAILGILTILVFTKIASVYARYKMNKTSETAVPLKEDVILAVAQEEGNTTILCKQIEGLPENASEEE